MISLTLNNQQLKARPDQTILDIIKANSINIPTLCHLPGKSSRDKPRAVCRICVVEIKGINGLVSACSTKATEGMEILTHSKPVINSRKVLMEFILAEHQGLKEGEDTRVRQLSDEIGVNSSRFTLPINVTSSVNKPVSEYFDIDSSRCIHCDRCIVACETRKVIARSGFGYNIVNSFGGELGLDASNCSYCGDCMAACPAGGIRRV